MLRCARCGFTPDGTPDQQKKDMRIHIRDNAEDPDHAMSEAELRALTAHDPPVREAVLGTAGGRDRWSN